VTFFAHLSSAFGSPYIQRQPLCDLLKPGGEVFDSFFSFGFDGKGKEDGLGGIFGVVCVPKDLEADVKDHPRVAAHDLLERLLTAGPNKLPEKVLRALGWSGPLRYQIRPPKTKVKTPINQHHYKVGGFLNTKPP
jgi:hypothetical protein